MIENKLGLTLIETMVVLVIFAFIIAAIYGTSTTGRTSWSTGEALVALQQATRTNLEEMVRELRLSTPANVTVAADQGSISFSIPFDGNGNGWLDMNAGQLIYGADDSADFDNDGNLWEAGWQIEYLIDADNQEIIRRVLDDTSSEVSRLTLIKNLNPDPAFSFFATDTDSGVGQPEQAVSIVLTAEEDTIQGRTIDPALRSTLRARVNFRN